MKNIMCLVLAFVLVCLSAGLDIHAYSINDKTAVSESGIADENNNLYAPYDSFLDLYEAYNVAVQNGDLEEQNSLEAIAKQALLAEIEICEEQADRLRYDPDEAYWKSQFPTYFSSGGFVTRSGEVSLALVPINRGVWTNTQKSNGWNSIYAKFYKDSRWDNTDCMKEQFYCHARLLYATIEGEWNLEPGKTSINTITCN